MAKKKWTKSERAAFARKMKAAKAKKSKLTTPKKSKKKSKKKSVSTKIVKTKREVSVMATKKKTTKKRPSGGRKKGFSFGNKNLFDQLQSGGVMVSGGLMAAFLANKLPIPNPTLRSLSPVLLGLLFGSTVGKSNKLAVQAAMGAIVVGGISALKSQFPNLPLLAGESEVIVDPSLLGYSGARELGSVRELGSDYYVSPATI